MSKPKPRQSVDISGLEEKLQAIADKEERSLSNLLRFMVVEAIGLREDGRPLKLQEVLHQLSKFNNQELAQLITKAVQLMSGAQRNDMLEQESLAGRTPTPDMADTQLAFRCFKKVVHGSKLNPPDLIKLAAALEIGTEDLQEMLEKLSGKKNGSRT